MDIVLVPGFWLDASSWTAILPPLVEAGHRVHPLTPPGLESANAPRAGIGLRQQIDAVIAVVDAIDGPVVLVGHSGGGAVIYGVTDARPDRIARAIYVDSGPLGPGESINDNLPYEGDDIPLPPWEFFDDADLVDLDDDLRAAFRVRAIPEPRRVAYDAMELHDERRLDVPTTVIACEFTAAQLSDWVGAGLPFVAELARLTDADYVDLPTGHWPQFTKPDELGAMILAAVER